MTATYDTERLEKEIGDRIDAAVKADSRSDADIAELLGISNGALDKIRQGKSTTQYAKLAQLAGILR
jgi:transcriptional regulator with XRE-family HTH domain